jgi:hypothetical protein
MARQVTFWLCREGSDGAASDTDEAEELGPERVYLIGVAVKGLQKRYGYSIEDSLQELARLADAAGLEVGCCLVMKPSCLTAATRKASALSRLALMHVRGVVKD